MNEPTEVLLYNIDKILFPNGLEGFPEWKNFRLQQTAEMMPIALLHCLDEDNLSFIVANPRTWFPMYQINAPQEELVPGKAEKFEELILLAIINVQTQPFAVTANLMGPLLINRENRLGMQLVLHDSPYLAPQPLTLKTTKLFMNDGLLGLPEWKSFVLQSTDELAPVQLLACYNEPDVSFPVIHPLLIDPKYRPDISDEDATALTTGDLTELEWLVMLNVKQNPFEVTANLKAPVVYNIRTGIARQVILENDYETAFPMTSQDITTQFIEKTS
ncbi:MAG: flagellar assembly protein FliW [Anaerolineaceae bacterium]|nr:flagellar assembly protein FliW [Anaerolineaceae bacterium]